MLPQVYHAWKLKNQKKNKEDNSTAPSGLQEAALRRGSAPAPPAKKKTPDRPQRFFRIPFVRPGDAQAPAGSKSSSTYKKRLVQK